MSENMGNQGIEKIQGAGSCDYPPEADVLVGTNFDNNTKHGSFDEDARNTDPGEANVIKDTPYKIKNVSKTGSFDEASRNTDPLEANVVDGVGYKIQNVAKTGSLKPMLPKTGQVTPQITGDDGYFQDGNPISPRFVDNGDNTVSDKATGLMWIKRPELIIPDGLNVNNIGVEKGDWAANTAFSAGDIATKPSDSSAWICLVAHTSINPPSYADSTPYGVGDVVYDAAGDGTYYQCGTAHTSSGANIAADTGGGWTQIATDASSLFAFDQSVNPSYWSQSIWATSNNGGGVNPVYMQWDSGVANAMITKSGHNDWKMPNLKELISIVNYGNVSPAIDTSVFPNTQSDYYWSSTIYAGNTDYAWVVYFFDGYVYSGNRYYSFYVRPVRQY